jgi:hypothetical protein
MNIFNIYFAPSRVFSVLKEKPQWITPFIIILVVVAATAAVTVTLTRETIIARQEEMFEERGMTDEQIEQGNLDIEYIEWRDIHRTSATHLCSRHQSLHSFIRRREWLQESILSYLLLGFGHGAGRDFKTDHDRDDEVAFCYYFIGASSAQYGQNIFFVSAACRFRFLRPMGDDTGGNGY